MTRLAILGCRGIPARYRGFETFAEKLALHLAGRGWKVTVYCQRDGGAPIAASSWRGVELVQVPSLLPGPLGTILFDLLSSWHAARTDQVMLTLGYNTAFLGVIHRVRGRRNVLNMDGLEWRRGKWSAPARAWLWLNERLGCWLGNRLVADHPVIERHLASRVDARKIVMIPYGSRILGETDAGPLRRFALERDGYALIMGQPQPDNSTLEMVAAFSSRSRGLPLAVLCEYDRRNPYHASVLEAAGGEVRFLGAVYGEGEVDALQAHCRLYLHGHQVGGTNPSLLEALGAGCAIVSHDNPFNRWVAGEAARYFRDPGGCGAAIEELIESEPLRRELRRRARLEAERFDWEGVLEDYARLLESRD